MGCKCDERRERERGEREKRKEERERERAGGGVGVVKGWTGGCPAANNAAFIELFDESAPERH